MQIQKLFLLSHQPSAINYQLSTNNNQPTKSLTYYCQGSRILDSVDSTGNMSSYLGREVRSIIKIDGNITTDYLIKNGKDVIAESDAVGKLKETYQYTPYGKPVDFEKTNPTLNTQHPTLSIDVNPFRYSSYYSDEESGLYYLNARYYSPDLMRFISRDTYNLNNRYAYGNSNPIANVDPTGHMSISSILGIVAGAIGLALSPFTGGSSTLLMLDVTSTLLGGFDIFNSEYLAKKTGESNALKNGISYGILGVTLLASLGGLLGCDELHNEKLCGW